MIINTSDATFFIENAEPYFQDHFNEVGQFVGKVDFEIKLDVYRTAYANGNLQIVCAWDEEINIMGWTIFWIGQHPYYADTFFAATDAVYVRPEYRGKGVLSALIESAEDLLIPHGVAAINWQVHESQDFGSRLEREGYKKETITYGKYIGD